MLEPGAVPVMMRPVHSSVEELPMAQHIGALALLVADYDQAITFFTQGLGFELLEDTPLDEPGKPGKRWCGLPQRGAPGSALLLARAATPTSRPPSVSRGRSGLPVSRNRRLLGRLPAHAGVRCPLL